MVAREKGGYVVSPERRQWAAAVIWNWINWCGDRGHITAVLNVGHRQLIAAVEDPPKCVSRKYGTRLDREPLKTAILLG